MGIEPTSEAWEAPVLPLNYTRKKYGSGEIRTHGRLGRRRFSRPVH